MRSTLSRDLNLALSCLRRMVSALPAVGQPFELLVFARPRLMRFRKCPDVTSAPLSAAPGNSPRRVLFASLIGTTIEFFDFYIYATAAALVFPLVFFSGDDPALARILSLTTFAIAFVARPVGGRCSGPSRRWAPRSGSSSPTAPSSCSAR